ncbi:hypothetical protein OIDMADRAFT_59257 [Oidiodendron maius Zn]|uniref:Uncharacterized protein n=1 Tax=Oidiodendron maius (strain Zn) TaxID=913774 RepID=A0A0C3CB99_OIDMZ|nr:hypothetical protein OIDMADRAFT_59257 [Oidiodendron maius Zn]
MSDKSNSTFFQLSGEYGARGKTSEISYQMHEYLNADPTITEYISYASNMAKGNRKKAKKNHGKRISSQLECFDKVMKEDSTRPS